VIEVILPLKSLRTAKLRLAGVLNAEERRELALAMLRDVVDAVRAAELAPGVLSPDPVVLMFAAEIGAVPVHQPRGVRSLNGALAWALDAGHLGSATGSDLLTPFRNLAPQGGGTVDEDPSSLIILPDVPLMRAEEIASLIAACEGAGPVVGVVPDRRERGTNAMLLRPPSAMPVSFGRGSFQRHVRAGGERRIDVRVHRLQGLGLDIDEPGDLTDFLKIEADTHTWALVSGWDVADRVERWLGTQADEKRALRQAVQPSKL
jgi:2-phospho-L-lactate guanylyltransferase (CobY/MobA/RfbA family)